MCFFVAIKKFHFLLLVLSTYVFYDFWNGHWFLCAYISCWKCICQQFSLSPNANLNCTGRTSYLNAIYILLLLIKTTIAAAEYKGFMCLICKRRIESIIIKPQPDMNEFSEYMCTLYICDMAIKWTQWPNEMCACF